MADARGKMNQSRPGKGGREGKKSMHGMTTEKAPAKVSLITVSLFALFTVSLAAATVMRNSIFHDPISLWTSAVESAPDKRRPHENFGQALSTAGKLNEALQQFKTVLALPDDGSVPLRDVHREIGVVYFRLGLIDESIISWQNGLRHAPYDPGILNNLSIAFMRQGRLDEALSHAEMALSVNPYMAEPANTLGEVHLARKDYEKAQHYFQLFIQLRPEDTRAYWNIALTMERAGNLEGAYQYATRYLSYEQNPRTRQTIVEFINHLRTAMDAGKRP